MTNPCIFTAVHFVRAPEWKQVHVLISGRRNKFCYICIVKYYTAMKTDVQNLDKISSEENLIQNVHVIVQVSQTDT